MDQDWKSDALAHVHERLRERIAQLRREDDEAREAAKREGQTHISFFRDKPEDVGNLPTDENAPIPEGVFPTDLPLQLSAQGCHCAGEMEELLTSEEAAAFFGFSVKSFRNLVIRGQGSALQAV